MGRRGEETPVRGKPQEEAGFRSFVSRPGLGSRCLNLALRAGAEARREAAGRGREVGGTGRDHAPPGGFKGGRADPGWFLYRLEGFLRPVLASSTRRVLPPPTRVSPRQPAALPAVPVISAPAPGGAPTHPPTSVPLRGPLARLLCAVAIPALGPRVLGAGKSSPVTFNFRSFSLG